MMPYFPVSNFQAVSEVIFKITKFTAVPTTQYQWHKSPLQGRKADFCYFEDALQTILSLFYPKPCQVYNFFI